MVGFQANMWQWWWRWWVVGCVALGLTSGATLATTDDTDRCVTTYKIQEYHVHSGDTGVDVETGSLPPLKRPPTLGLGGGGGVVRREQLYREKSKWLKRIDELQSELIAEKMKRLGQLDRMMESPVATEASSRQRLQDRPTNDVSKQDGPAPGKVKPVTPCPVVPRPERTPQGNNAAEDVDVRRFMTDIRLTMQQVQKELRNVKSKNTRLHRTYKRLAGSHRQLHKEYLRSQERLKRLQAFQRTEMAKIMWQIGNETNRCDGAVAALRRQVVCLDDLSAGSCTGAADGRTDKRTGSGRSTTADNRPGDVVAMSHPPSVTVRPPPGGRKTDETER
ncbi:hypothetical protein LSAT2_019937 [Lamellibrachia satsuma]|nr:hypothetical protein LSAT2_019937 [Lamellibrachia satsuma]